MAIHKVWLKNIGRVFIIKKCNTISFISNTLLFIYTHTTSTASILCVSRCRGGTNENQTLYIYKNTLKHNNIKCKIATSRVRREICLCGTSKSRSAV